MVRTGACHTETVAASTVARSGSDNPVTVSGKPIAASYSPHLQPIAGGSSRIELDPARECGWDSDLSGEHRTLGAARALLPTLDDSYHL